MKKEDQARWQKIYALTADYYRLAPWKWLEEHDIFGVRTTGSGKTYFISVMGSAGVIEGMSAYEGARALGQFWEFQDRGEGQPPEAILTIPHLILTFSGPEHINPEQQELMEGQQQVFSEKGNWPDIKRVVPGWVPDVPGIEWLIDIEQILEQTLDVCTRAKEDPNFIHPEEHDDDVYLIRSFNKDNGQPIWQDQYEQVEDEEISYTLTPKQATLERFVELPEKDGVLQTDLVMLPTPINDEKHGPYFPFVLIATSKANGRVEGFKLLQPIPDLDTLHNSVPETFMELMGDAGYRPKTLEIRHPLLYDLLEQVLPNAGINLTKTDTLKTVDDAVNNFLESMEGES